MARRNHRDTRNWESVSVGILTLATILAAATSAGIFAVAAELFHPSDAGYPGWLRLMAMFLAMASLSAYVIAVASGFASLFRRSPASGIAVTRLAAVWVFVQAYTAVTAALFIIFYQTLEEISKLI